MSEQPQGAAAPITYHDLPYLVAFRNENASFALYPNGAVRRIAGAIEFQRLVNELGVRQLSISGEEHDAYANISQTLFGF
jgi:hypothetical protein